MHEQLLHDSRQNLNTSESSLTQQERFNVKTQVTEATTTFLGLRI